MRSYMGLFILFLFLLFTGIPALAQMGIGPGGQQMDGHGKATQMMEYGKNIREQQGMHGLGFMYSAGNAYGEYVTFTIDEKTGNVLNYGVNGNSLFNISIADFNYKSASTRGSITWVSNMDGSTSIQLHDNPAAVINIPTSKGISITFTLAEGATAFKEDDLIRIESGSVLGYITGTGTMASTVTGSLVKVDVSPESVVVFRAAPINMPMFDHLYQRFSKEIARNRIGMEIALGRNGTYSAINYSAGIQLKVQEMDRDRIRLRINATETAGPIIALNLDNSSIVLRERERLRIHYDGQPLQCVDDPNIVFNDTDRPLCWISPIQDRVRTQLMIHVTNWSEHTIDIVVEPEVTATPSLTPALTPAVTTVKPAETTATPGFGLSFSIAGILIWFLIKRCNK